MSWTLSQDIARRFAERQAIFTSAECLVISTEILKEDVYAYFNGRGEEEIVVQQSLINGYEVLEVIAKSDRRP